MSDDWTVVKSALSQLTGLCNTSTENAATNRATLTRFGAGSNIVAVMNKWHLVPSIQAHGCCALTNIVFDNSVFGATAKEIGCLDAIAWAMARYPGNEDVQNHGCAALGNFSHNQKSNTKYIVKELNGATLIVSAMKTHPQCADLQYLASFALNCFSHWNELKKAVQEAGAEHALVDAWTNHHDESKEFVKEIQEDARSAFRKLLNK